MKVLYISNSSAMSGAPKALFNLVSGFVAGGGEAAVVIPDKKGPLYSKLEEAGIKTYCSIPYGLTIWPRCVNPIKKRKRIEALEDKSKVTAFIESVLDDFHPDIVHTNVGPLDIAFEICRKRGISHVWHLREYQDKDFGMTFYPSREKFEELIHSEGNFNIAITRDIFQHWKLRDCDAVFYDGVQSEVYDKTTLKEKYFLYAARIEKAKGFGTLARAFRKFHKQRKDFRLIVAGRPCGMYGVFWRCWCRISMPRNAVIFTGMIPDIAKLMNSATALIVPSRCEGFGFSTAEAMLNDCPVIGKNTGGTKEQFDNILEHTGIEGGLRFTDKKDLIRQMKVAVSGDDLSAMKNAAANTVNELYRMDNYIKNICCFYTTILKG